MKVTKIIYFSKVTASKSTPLAAASESMSKSTQHSIIPIVPYDSYEEYETMLKTLVQEYQRMVEEGVRLARMDIWCRWHKGLSRGVESHWLQEGTELYLKLTKGQGKEWCDTMNNMVVHALDTAVRVMVMTREEMGHPMHGSENDRRKIAVLLKRETMLAISDLDCSAINLTLFYEKNFQCFLLSEFQLDDDGERTCLGPFPISHIQDMKLAFAMLSHKRLGESTAGRVLNSDLMKKILVDVWNINDTCT